MTNFLILANWKANKNLADTKKWLDDFNELSRNQNFDKIEIAIAPPFNLLSQIPQFSLCAQNISSFDTGPYTGEIPARLLTTKYCLIGHSERRKFLHETNQDIEQKLAQAINNNIIPIICAQTIDEIPNNIRNFNPNQYLIMYEPATAISTDGNYHPESPEKIQSVLETWQSKLNLTCRFLYGGSINKEFISEIRNLISQLSGIVVGHASLDATSFYSIIKECQDSLVNLNVAS